MIKRLMFFLLLLTPLFVSAQSKYNSAYSRLFTPVQFYPDVVAGSFSFDNCDTLNLENTNQVQAILRRIYLTHPELVQRVAREESKRLQVIEQQNDTIKTVVTEKEVVIPAAEEIAAAPVQIVVKKPNFWQIGGEYYLQMMQNAYSDNWYQGGESNYSVLGRVTMNFDYNNKQKIRWENKLEMNLGLQTFQGDTVHKIRTSSDLLRLTNRLGLQASKHWYYTFQSVAYTQFMSAYGSNSHNASSCFLSPLVLNLSVGMDYKMKWLKGRLTGNVHIAPMALNYTYVGKSELRPKFGIEKGSGKVDWGPNFTVDAAWKMSDNISWKTRLYAYSTFHRTELQWENTFNLNINRFLAATIYVYPRFDDQSHKLKDDKYGYFQLKEYTSLGFTYSF